MSDDGPSACRSLRSPATQAVPAAPRLAPRHSQLAPSFTARAAPGASAPTAVGRAARARPCTAARAALIVVTHATLCTTAALRISSPSERPPLPWGVLTTNVTAPEAMQVDRGLLLAAGASPRRPWRRRHRRARRSPARKSAVPFVATIPMPSWRRRLATTRPAGLSRSARDRNTVPAGLEHRAGGQLGLVERPPERRVDAHHLARRAHLRPERRVDVGEPGERQDRLLDGHGGRPRRLRRGPRGATAPRRAVRRAWRRASPASPPWPAGRQWPWRRTAPCGSPAGWPR